METYFHSSELIFIYKVLYRKRHQDLSSLIKHVKLNTKVCKTVASPVDTPTTLSSDKRALHKTIRLQLVAFSQQGTRMFLGANT